MNLFFNGDSAVMLKLLCELLQKKAVKTFFGLFFGLKVNSVVSLEVFFVSEVNHSFSPS